MLRDGFGAGGPPASSPPSLRAGADEAAPLVGSRPQGEGDWRIADSGDDEGVSCQLSVMSGRSPARLCRGRHVAVPGHPLIGLRRSCVDHHADPEHQSDQREVEHQCPSMARTALRIVAT